MKKKKKSRHGKRMSEFSDNDNKERIKRPWGAPLEASGRGNLVPDFRLPGCSRDIVKFYEEHVFEADVEGGLALLNSGSARVI